MAPTSKSKVREPEPDEDISQLRKPIILGGKPVEQILNSIHYGSSELSNLLLNECDMIFECKVCRALFRDLPNFIAHKRRFCTKFASEINHFIIGESPEERVIIVQPQPVDESEVSRVRSSSSSSSHSNLEDTLLRIRSGDIGNSHAFQVYTSAAAKLKHQKDHTRITTLRPREIPTNSNAVFIDVKSTSVNIHDRVKDDELDNKKTNSQAGSSNRRKIKPGRKRTNCNSYNYSNNEEKQLRSRASTNNSSSRSSNKKSDELTDRLIKELKVIQNKVKNKSQESLKPVSVVQNGKESANEISLLKQTVHSKDFIRVKGRRENEKSTLCKIVKNKGVLETTSCSKTGKDNYILEKTGKNLRDLSSKSGRNEQNNLSASDLQHPSPSVSNISSDSEEDDIVIVKRNDKERLGKSNKSLICSKCGKIFSCSKSLQFHFKITHGIQKMFYPCPCCSNVYYYLDNVTRHLRTNHNKTEKEIDEMRQISKSRAFSKPSPSRDPSSARVVKLGMSGSRRSLRYKEAISNRRLGNAPFVYSSLNREKKLLAKRDPVLSAKSENFLPKEELVTAKSLQVEANLGATPEKSCPVLQNMSNGLCNATENNKLTQSGRPKSFGDIGMQMKTCSKCSRLFGRKSTYEKHIEVCSGLNNTVTGDENEDKQKKDKNVSDGNSSSTSTRRKSKNPKPVSALSSQITTNLSNDTSAGGDKRDSRSRRPQRILIPEDSGDDCANSPMIENGPEHNHVSPRSDFIAHGAKVLLKACKLVSPIKIKIDRGSQNGCNLKSEVTSKIEMSDASESWTSSQSGNKESCSGDASTSSQGLSSNVIKLKSNVSSSAVRSNASRVRQDDGAVDIKNVIQDRPRRKRKVPSRNVEAVEMLQKIHQSDEPKSEKRLKSSTGDIESFSRKSVPVKLQSQKVSQGPGKSTDNNMSDEIGSISKSKRRSSKIFISNKNKLECYNLSKVENFMDVKRKKCRKCKLRFSTKASLKTHVVRCHLKWSRFQCKLCNFNCFHRSECSTHIRRTHLKGKRADRNPSINSWIIDLSKKGSEAMALKRHETLKAKNQQQEGEEEKDGLYKHGHSQRVHRLPERKSDNSNSPISTTPPSKQKNDHKKPTTPVKKDKTSPSSSSVDTQAEKDKLSQSRKVVHISHLVPRRPRMAASTSQYDVSPFNTSHSISIKVSSSEAEKQNLSDLSLQPLSASSKSDDEECSSTKSMASTSSVNDSSTSSNTSMSLKRMSLPFNISTRKSPRVFDTSPYSREETINTPSSHEESKVVMQSMCPNEVIMHTRNGAYTKTLPPIPIIDSIKPKTVLGDNGEHSKEKDEIKLSDVSLQPLSASPKSDDEECSSTKSMASTSSANDSSTSSNTSASVKRISLPLNTSTRKSTRVWDTSPYSREETIATPSLHEESKVVKQQVCSNEVIMHTRHGAYTKTLPPIPISVIGSTKPKTFLVDNGKQSKENDEIVMLEDSDDKSESDNST